MQTCEEKKDKAPILRWKHMAFNICQDSKSNQYKDERFCSNNLLDTEPHRDNLKSFAKRSWDKTVMDMKKTGTATN